MNAQHYDKLIFELSHAGRTGYSLPQGKEVNAALERFPLKKLGTALRTEQAPLPEVDELSCVRHYTAASLANFGVDTGFYPLGSCTMKYNPKINEQIAQLPWLTDLHPAQAEGEADGAQGALRLYYETEQMLCQVAGMSRFTLCPYAGAHGELTGLMVIRRYHESRNDTARTKVLIPDSAHGTNPASAAVCGLQVVQVRSLQDGTVDVDHLHELLSETGPQVAAMMMTNPNTLGIFERNIPQIAKAVHEAGGLMYYDGANLNPLLGVCRPGDMGFDVMHTNLHKTFATPHGGGGPGSGPVGVREGLEKFLPNPRVDYDQDTDTFHLSSSPEALGSISAFLGNYGVIVRAYCYLRSLGKEHIGMAGRLSTLNANYVKEKLRDCYQLPIDGLCKHEFVFDGLKAEYGGDHHDPTHVTTLDVAKRLLDYGFHAPTIYFPLLFHEAMMIEPTETESMETLDEFIRVMRKIAAEAKQDPSLLKTAPHTTPIGRPDDVKAVKDAKFTFDDL